MRSNLFLSQVDIVMKFSMMNINSYRSLRRRNEAVYFKKALNIGISDFT